MILLVGFEPQVPIFRHLNIGRESISRQEIKKTKLKSLKNCQSNKHISLDYRWVTKKFNIFPHGRTLVVCIDNRGFQMYDKYSLMRVSISGRQKFFAIYAAIWNKNCPVSLNNKAKEVEFFESVLVFSSYLLCGNSHNVIPRYPVIGEISHPFCVTGVHNINRCN